MTTAEKIIQHLSSLPEHLQATVLEFIEYIEERDREPKQTDERTEWSKLSLTYAMRGMEDERAPYSVKDIKEEYK